MRCIILKSCAKGITTIPAIGRLSHFFRSIRWQHAVLASTGVESEVAMLLTANGLLLGAFVLLSLYADSRAYNRAAAGYTALAFGLFPPTFFFRMGYSESSFLFLAILAMIAMQRGWPSHVVAAIVGLATSTRPVGVALVPVFWLFVLQTAPSRRIGWFRAVAFTPIALSGLIAYMAYQYAAFDDGLAFVRTQEHWCRREGVSTGEKVQALLSYEPIWSVYDPGDWGYWRRQDSKLPAAVSLSFANPIYFLLGGACL